MHVQNFDNKFPIKWVILLLISILCMCFINELVLYFFDTYYLQLPHIIRWKGEIAFFMVCLIALLLVSVSSAQCQYRIVGDIFVIREKFMGKVTLDLTLPIAHIKSIQLSRDINHWSKHIILNIGDKIYHLNVVTYKVELYNTLTALMAQSKKGSDSIYFYKQNAGKT